MIEYATYYQVICLILNEVREDKKSHGGFAKINSE